MCDGRPRSDSFAALGTSSSAQTLTAAILAAGHRNVEAESMRRIQEALS
jgi:hypothetical protein